MIDLNRFTTEHEVVVPIVDNMGKAHSRAVRANVENGWYKVSLGNKVRVLRPASLLEIEKTLSKLPSLRMYALGVEGIPINFDNLFKRGFGEAVEVHFLSQPLFTVIKAIQWEDGRWYYYEPDQRFERENLTTLTRLFNERAGLSTVRGVTPEQRYYFLLANLQRNSYESFRELESRVLTEVERTRRKAQFKMDIGDRINRAITDAGGTYIEHRRVGNYFSVTWEINGQKIKSNIRDDMRITSAGFCLSGHDAEHSLNSIVQLAKLYQDDDELNITRE